MAPFYVVAELSVGRKKMSGWKPAVKVDKCPKCGKSVYANEAKLAAGSKWHTLCFKCGQSVLL